ncbi:MAG: GNAT family N-acetyltransferase [Gammaproteobacteria bacterium]|nr:MAG: GNAT family N-acetyltransferase [Gammaproteobacteria bacterium]
MNIKIASEEDNNEWLRLRIALWPDVSKTIHEKEISVMLSNPERFVSFIAFDVSNKSIGFIEVSVHEVIDEGCVVKHIGYIEALYVEPKYQGKGFGSELIRLAEKWVSDQGLKEIAVDTNLDNIQGQNLYQVLGYKEQDRLVLYRKGLNN